MKGQHEPIVPESLFKEAQEILDGRKRAVKPKIVSMANLPLRGFLKCPKCSRMLTGSASKGKMNKYYYYYREVPIDAQLDALNTRMQNARIQKVEGTLDDDDFQMLKRDIYSKIEQLEERLCKLSVKHKEIKNLLERGL